MENDHLSSSAVDFSLNYNNFPATETTYRMTGYNRIHPNPSIRALSHLRENHLFLLANNINKSPSTAVWRTSDSINPDLPVPAGIPASPTCTQLSLHTT
ncbi:hypothetical protein L596_007083 [Steinernema carpocapsae]|uniref:Uncharacterized protein n=1 Tax=Steinernema carpocapsae TaxID=34508 RepID=A0A4U5P8L1_STECR|nr:hypothetical protein L596_007083 [Steinernema carpocapsae]